MKETHCAMLAAREAYNKLIHKTDDIECVQLALDNVRKTQSDFHLAEHFENLKKSEADRVKLEEMDIKLMRHIASLNIEDANTVTNSIGLTYRNVSKSVLMQYNPTTRIDHEFIARMIENGFRCSEEHLDFAWRVIYDSTHPYWTTCIHREDWSHIPYIL